MASAFRQVAFVTTGLLHFTKNAYLNRQNTFTKDALNVDLNGKVYVITGANSGIGKETAKAILARGGVVHLVCRSKDRAEDAKQELIEQTGNPNAYVHVLDLSDIRKVKAFARNFVESGQTLDVLVNNAGCMEHERKLTEDGVEKNFATNTLGTYVLTEELIPSLSKVKNATVITVSSGGMLTQDLKIDDIQCDKMNPFDATFAYAQHKRQQVCITEEWGRKFAATNIKFQSMHPGWADTPAVRVAMPDFHAKMKDKLRTAEQGADTVVWLSIAHEARNFPSGTFFLDRVPAGKHLPMAWSSYTDNDVKQLDQQLQQLAQPLQPTAQDLASFAYIRQLPQQPLPIQHRQHHQQQAKSEESKL